MEHNYPPEMIQNIPVPILKDWRCETPSPNNDLDLIEDIMKNGITGPVEIGVGIFSRKVRLNTGNHRIYLAPRLGMSALPCICRVWNYCAFNNSNGDHSFSTPYITKKQEWIEKEYWAAPNTVLDLFELMKNMKIK